MDFEAMAGIVIALAVVGYAIYNRITGNSSTTGASKRGSSDKAGASASLGNAPDDVIRWAATAQQLAQQYGLPWRIVLAQIWQESWGDPNAMGSSGEVGLMQIKEIAYQDLLEAGYEVPDDWKTNPVSNIHVGTAYLHLMRERSGTLADAVGKVKADALESYNEGFSRAKQDIELDQYTNKVLTKAQKLGYNV